MSNNKVVAIGESVAIVAMGLWTSRRDIVAMDLELDAQYAMVEAERAILGNDTDAFVKALNDGSVTTEQLDFIMTTVVCPSLHVPQEAIKTVVINLDNDDVNICHIAMIVLTWARRHSSIELLTRKRRERKLQDA